MPWAEDPFCNSVQDKCEAFLHLRVHIQRNIDSALYGSSLSILVEESMQDDVGSRTLLQLLSLVLFLSFPWRPSHTKSCSRAHTCRDARNPSISTSSSWSGPLLVSLWKGKCVSLQGRKEGGVKPRENR